MPELPPPDSFDYSPHALRLDGREWSIVLGLVLLFAILAPRLWNKFEKFEPADDYRLPYSLSEDYWLYQRHLQEATEDPDAIFVIGDSVMWGEYVTADGTLSHFLISSAGGRHQFVNAGINGLFPLALEGLVQDFAGPVRKRRVLLHANLLWMTSPEADLSSTKEQKFNHETLVPQFSVRIPCYRAKLEQRLSHLVNRKVGLFSWTEHLQIAYFDHLGIPAWTLEPGNAYRNPLAQLTGKIPEEPAHDPDRGEASPRHRPWSDGSRQPQQFDWVAPADSLQWAAFQRLVTLLQERDNEVLVVIGPLNEHMIATQSRKGFLAMQRAMQAWLNQRGIPNLSPSVLPSELYGDTSHPLTQGYARLAQDLIQSPVFQNWLK